MKKLLLISVFAFASAPAMQKPEQKIFYNKPIWRGDYWDLLAFDGTKTVGQLMYREHNKNSKHHNEYCFKKDICNKYQNCWELAWIDIDNDYRNKGIATQLFRRCINHIWAQDDTHLFWWAVPMGPEEHQLTIDSLISVYKKLCKNVALPEPEILARSNSSATMVVHLP